MEATWAAVVVNHNAGGLLERCCRSLLDEGAGEVVVVDNGSTDGSADDLEALGLPVVVVRAPNLGYAAGANTGIARTSAPVVAVLNPDARVEPGAGSALVARFAEEDVAAVGPRIVNVDGSTYPSARLVPSVIDAVGHGLVSLVWRGNPFSRRYWEADRDPAAPRDVDWVSGAAVWLRRRALDAVGGWDERYFMYVEDVDLCWRLREAGWRVVYEPAGVVEHVQGSATDRRPDRMVVEHHRSLLRFAARRWRGVRKVALVPAAAFLALRALLVMARRRIVRATGLSGARRGSG